jgi:hypothetical protein
MKRNIGMRNCGCSWIERRWDFTFLGTVHLDVCRDFDSSRKFMLALDW